jgi:hypothetical protein
MPLTKGKYKQIGKRHYIGDKGGISGSATTAINTTVTKIESNVKSGANQLRRKKKLSLPIRYGTERHETITNYAPVWTNNTLYTVVYGDKTIQSNDLLIYKYGDKYYCKKSGVWRIDAFLLNTPNNASALTWTDHSLYLYKNGVIYSTLDSNTVYTAFGIGQNYYDLYDTLKGQDLIELNENDYIEIKYQFTAGQPLGATDYIYSRLLITYENKQGETI